MAPSVRCDNRKWGPTPRQPPPAAGFNPPALLARLLKLEQEVSNLVNAAYGPTADEVALLWQTAPPRMPISGPEGLDPIANRR